MWAARRRTPAMQRTKRSYHSAKSPLTSLQERLFVRRPQNAEGCKPHSPVCVFLMRGENSVNRALTGFICGIQSYMDLLGMLYFNNQNVLGYVHTALMLNSD